MKHLFALGFAALALATSFSASAFDMKHKGLACESCHRAGPGVAPGRDACLACHKTDEIVKATERFNFTFDWKNPETGKVYTTHGRINPHDNFHYGTSDACTNCHREHKPSTLTCNTCHDSAAVGLKPPR